MSETASSDKSEPSPFERFRYLAGRVVNVPKAKADEEERKIRKERAEGRSQRRPKRKSS